MVRDVQDDLLCIAELEPDTTDTTITTGTPFTTEITIVNSIGILQTLVTVVTPTPTISASSQSLLSQSGSSSFSTVIISQIPTTTAPITILLDYPTVPVTSGGGNAKSKSRGIILMWSGVLWGFIMFGLLF
jgi:hypothetical protein